jgi:uncharacterized protein YcaQ
MEYPIIRYSGNNLYVQADPDILEGMTGIPRGFWILIYERCAYPHKVVKYALEAWWYKESRKETEQVLFEDEEDYGGRC